MDRFSEPEKNFFRCAAMIFACLVFFVWRQKVVASIICALLILIFVAIPIITNKKGVDWDKLAEEPSKKKNSSKKKDGR